MAKTKVAVSLDARLVKNVDTLVRQRRYPSRSAAIEAALRTQAKASREEDYESMLDQIDPEEERALANERYKADVL